MLERPLPAREGSGRGPRGLDDNPAPGLATVSHGLHAESLPVAGMTVGEIRARFRDLFDIDPQSFATVDGVEAGNDVRLRPGQMLMFLRRGGEKG